jgi:hypothetical protein
VATPRLRAVVVRVVRNLLRVQCEGLARVMTLLLLLLLLPLMWRQVPVISIPLLELRVVRTRRQRGPVERAGCARIFARPRSARHVGFRLACGLWLLLRILVISSATHPRLLLLLLLLLLILS